MGETKFPTEILGVLASLAFSVVAWLMADARSKARMTYIEERMHALEAQQDYIAKTVLERLGNSEVKLARTEQDRIEIHRLIERLDANKASKEIVDSFRAEVGNLRSDIDRRFDNLERLLTKNM